MHGYLRYVPVLMLTVAVLVTMPACQTIELGRHDFRVRDGELYRGNHKFTLEAFYSPGVGESAAEVSNVVPPMVRAARVGGNTLSIDLAGFNEDGSAIDPEAVQTIDALAHRMRHTRMACIVRVFGDNEDRAFRDRAVRTAANALGRQGQVVYLFDGPGAAEYAAEFKRRCPQRVVIAPANGDLTLVGERPAEYPGHLVVLDDIIPDFDLGDQHFILSGDEEDYEQLDLALMRPEEADPPEFDPAMLPEDEREQGFVPLFNGEDLSGWWFKNPDTRSFHVNDCGVIEWREKGAAALFTARRYSDFILRLDWKILPGANSGIFLRAPRGARESRIGIECQLLGDSDEEEPNHQNTGSVYDVLAPLAMPANPEGEWNTLEIHFEGPIYKAWINGELVQEANFDEHEELEHRLRDGFIGLQDHTNFVAFRNLRIKEL